MARKKIYLILQCQNSYSIKIPTVSKFLQCQNSTVSDFNIRKRNTGALLHAWQRLFA